MPRAPTAALDVDKLRRASPTSPPTRATPWAARGRLHVCRPDARPAESDGASSSLLVVADEGPGVAGEMRERLFEPFVTLGKKGGTGLGLAVARRFVEDHGGTLELLPDTEGPGARFRFRMPPPACGRREVA